MQGDARELRALAADLPALLSENPERRARVLADPRYIVDALETRGVDFVREVLATGDDAPTAALRAAWAASMHILRGDPGQLRAQMYARLLGRHDALARRWARLPGEPAWLRLMAPSFRTTPRVLAGVFTTGDAGGERRVILRADGAEALTAASHGRLAVWDVVRGRRVSTVTTGVDIVEALAFSAGGERAVVVGRDGGLSVWDAASGRVWVRPAAAEGGRHAGVALDARGARALVVRDERTLELWDLDAQRPVRRLPPAPGPLDGAVALSPDAHMAFAVHDESSIGCWNLLTGGPPRLLGRHTGLVQVLAFAGVACRLVSVGWDRALCVWDPAGGCLRRVEGLPEWCRAVAVDSDCRRVVLAFFSRNVHSLDVAGDAPLAVLGHHDEVVVDVSLSADGRVAASLAEDGRLRVWDVEMHAVGTAEPDSMRDVAGTPDGRRYVAVSQSGDVSFWRHAWVGARQHAKGHSEEPWSVALSHDGALAVTGGHDRIVRVWDARRAVLLRELSGHTDGVLSVALSADGRRAASAAFDFTIRIWNPRRGTCLRTLRVEPAAASALRLSPTGGRLLSLINDGRVLLWDVRARRAPRVVARAEPYTSALAWSSSGARCAFIAQGLDIAVVDLKIGHVICRLPAADERGRAPSRAVLSPCGAALAFTSLDGRVCLVDVRSGLVRAVFQADGALLGCTLARDRRTLCVADSSGRLHFFRLVDGHPAVTRR